MRARLGALDGLRGVAIALVLWYHVWEVTWLRADVPLGAGRLNVNAIPETGFLGVDLFFFISGFCLFMPYAEAAVARVRPPSLAAFAYRRALKILPSYVFSIAALSVLGLTHYPTLIEAAREITLHLLFIHIWFADSYGAINGVLWSLAVEVQFYIVFPLLAWCAMRRPFATFAALAVAANVFRYAVRDAYGGTHLMNQLPATLDLFGAGMLAAYGERVLAAAPRSARRRTAWTLVSLAGFGLCALVVRGAYDARVFADWPDRWIPLGRPLLTLALPAATVGALLSWPAWQRVLASPALIFLSLVSYNLYLWHTVVVRALLDARFPFWRGVAAHADPAAALSFTFVAFAAALAVASVVTFGLERPLLRARPFAPRSVRRCAPSLPRTFEGPTVLEP